MRCHSLLFDGGLMKGRSEEVSYSLILNVDFDTIFKPNFVLFTHKTPTRALPWTRWEAYSAPQTPSCIFHTLAVRKGLRPFLSAAIYIQIIFLE